MAFTKINAAGIGTTETVTVDGLTVINNESIGGNLTVTGNATISGVLTYEDVTNVDSVGLITARNGIVVGSGITLSKDGDGFFTGIVTATSFSGSGANLTGIDTDLVSDTSPQLGGNLDVNTKNILLADSGSASDDRIIFGTGSDLHIYFDGSNSYIKEPNSVAGQLIIDSWNGTDIRQGSTGELMIRAIGGGSVELYENGTKVAETTSGGFNVEGVTYSNGLDMDDSHKILLGTDDDLELYHNGSNAYIKNGTGQLLIRSGTHTFENAAGSSEYARIDSNGRLGVGIASPTKLLDIATSTSADGIRIRSTGNTYNDLSFDANRTSANTHIARIISHWNGTAVSYISMDAGSDTTNKDDGMIRFWTANGSGNYERLRITSAGKVGINKTSPVGNLEVSDTSSNVPLIRIETSDGGNKRLDLKVESSNGVISAEQSAQELHLKSTSNTTISTNGSERFRIDTSGNLKFNSGYGSVKEAYGVRAWANYDHVAATIRGSAQLTSVTDTSTGRGTFNWAFTFVDQYYAAVGTSGGGGGNYGDDNAVTWAGSDHGTTTLSFRTDNFKTNANHDSDNLNVVIVR